jgi:hypothetical protein
MAADRAFSVQGLAWRTSEPVHLLSALVLEVLVSSSVTRFRSGCEHWRRLNSLLILRWRRSRADSTLEPMCLDAAFAFDLSNWFSSRILTQFKTIISIIHSQYVLYFILKQSLFICSQQLWQVYNTRKFHRFIFYSRHKVHFLKEKILYLFLYGIFYTVSKVLWFIFVCHLMYTEVSTISSSAHSKLLRYYLLLLPQLLAQRSDHRSTSRK